jgi:predicted RNase H-like HicB family nuclease
VILTNGEDGYILAAIPVIPGCISQDKTVEEALANIKEAADLWPYGS